MKTRNLYIVPVTLLFAAIITPASAAIPISSLTISNADAYETCPAADPPVKHATFTVTLIRPASGFLSAETVNYATQNGTGEGVAAAEAGKDYVAQSGTLKFFGNVSQRQITVEIIPDGDTDDENFDEEFSVVLSNPSINTTVQDFTGVATIHDLDPSLEECQSHSNQPSPEEPPSPGEFPDPNDDCNLPGRVCTTEDGL